MDNDNREPAQSAGPGSTPPHGYPPYPPVSPVPPTDAIDQTQTMPAALDELPPAGQSPYGQPPATPADYPGSTYPATNYPGSTYPGTNYPPPAAEQPTSSYPPVGGYGGYDQGGAAGYNQPPAYGQQPSGYGQPAGYGQPGGYEQPTGYDQPGGYQAAPPAYGQPSGYQPTTAYPPAAYGQPDSYRQPDAYGAAPGAPYQQGGYQGAPADYGYGQPPPANQPQYATGPGHAAETPRKKSHVGLWTLLVVAVVIIVVAAVTFIVKPSFLFKKVLDHSAVEQTIEQQSNGVLTNVSCPANEKVKAGTTFQCTAAGNKKVTVTIKDSKANYQWSLAS